jgi:hypothetical protein
MVKTFFVEEGHMARCGGLWYEPGILLIVEPHERVDVFVAEGGMPTTFEGRFAYERLNVDLPPAGLLGAGHLNGGALHEVEGCEAARLATTGRRKVEVSAWSMPKLPPLRRPVLVH